MLIMDEYVNQNLFRGFAIVDLKHKGIEFLQKANKQQKLIDYSFFEV